VVVREWDELELAEKLDVLRQLLIAQSGMSMNSLAVLCGEGLISPDEIESLIELMIGVFENAEVGDAADIIRFRQRLESLMVEARTSLEEK
jgi:hypothetical protein